MNTDVGSTATVLRWESHFSVLIVVGFNKMSGACRYLFSFQKDAGRYLMLSMYVAFTGKIYLPQKYK